MKKFLSISFNVVAALILTAGVVWATTSIGTSITSEADLTVTSGARIGTGSTPDSFTALADDSLFVEGILEVDGAVDFGSTMTVSDDATFATEVGIGTTTPYSILSVSTPTQVAGSTKLLTVASTTGTSLFQVKANGIVTIGKSTYSHANLIITASSTDVTALSLVNDAQTGTADTVAMNFALNRVAGTIDNAGKIVVGKEQQWTTVTSSRDAYMDFYTGLNGSDSFAARITSAGNFGIGTTTPAARLQSTAATEQLRLTYSTNPTKYTSFTTGSTGDLTITPSGGDIIASGTLKVDVDTAIDLVNVIDGSTEVFTILDGGNVGVGSSTPMELFSIGSGVSTTIDISKGCFQGNSYDGTRYHFWFKNDGNIGTGTGNCP